MAWALVSLAGLVVVLVAASARAEGGTVIKTEVDDDDKNGRQPTRLVRYEGRFADGLELARLAGWSPETYALARVLASESSGPEQAWIAIAWAVRNYADRRGKGIFELIADDVSSLGGEHGHGRFGRQSRRGRYAASHRDPPPRLLQIADDVLRGRVDDPTGGAVQWDSPRSQGIQKGSEGKSADDVARNRMSEGKELVLLDGIPERDLRFWRPIA